MPQEVTLTKSQLRNILLTRLKEQKEEEFERKVKLIENKLLEQEEFVKAKRIMFYLAFDGEVKTKNMINKARELDKEIYAPICDREEKMLKPGLLSNDSTLVKGPYQAWEPQTTDGLSLEELDLVIVPGVGFDAHNNRLGRGKGYYDRLLKQTAGKVYSMGLAFDFQVLPKLPLDSHDMPVDKVISA